MNLYVDRRHIVAIAAQIAPMCDGDDDLLADMMCGETNIDWLVTRLHEQLARDTEMLVGIKERKAAIAEREARISARIDKVKEQIGSLLRAARLTKLPLPEVTYSIREGKPGLKVVDPQGVPEEYQRIKREPDKAAINEAFENATELPNWLVRELPRDVVTARTK